MLHCKRWAVDGVRVRMCSHSSKWQFYWPFFGTRRSLSLRRRRFATRFCIHIRGKWCSFPLKCTDSGRTKGCRNFSPLSAVRASEGAVIGGCRVGVGACGSGLTFTFLDEPRCRFGWPPNHLPHRCSELFADCITRFSEYPWTPPERRARIEEGEECLESCGQRRSGRERF